MSRLILLLASCHVFEEATVECTSDLPCAKGDSDADTDSDTDTGEPAGDPTLGWTVSLVGGSNGRVRVYEPVNHEIVAEWAGFGTVGGLAYYEPSSAKGVLLADDEIILLNDDGTTSDYGSGIDGTYWDASRLGKKGALAFQGGIFAFDADLQRTTELVAQDTFPALEFLGGNSDIAYFSDPANGGPDLWSVRTDGTSELLIEDYDSSTTRGVNVFVGANGDAYACSSAGAVYAVSDLAEGHRSPLAYYDGSLSDVESCDWDEGSQQFLLYSPSNGIFRMDENGDAEQVFSPPNGYTLNRVYFYEAG